jgi:hypothetical protein
MINSQRSEMDTLTFIAEVTRVVAWPSAAVTTALIFREQLRALLSRIRNGKVEPAEFEFEQEYYACRQWQW